MKRAYVIGVLFAVAAVAAGGYALVQGGSKGLPSRTLKALRGAETFELITLDPGMGWMWTAEEMDHPDPAKFHHVIVLGREVVGDATMREELISAPDQAVLEDGARAACFHPRHAIHAVRGAKVVDLLICFECHGLFILEGDKRVFVRVGESAVPAFQKAAERLKMATVVARP